MTVDVSFKLLLFHIVTDQSAEWTHFVRLLMFCQFILADARKDLLTMLAHPNLHKEMHTIITSGSGDSGLSSMEHCSLVWRHIYNHFIH